MMKMNASSFQNVPLPFFLLFLKRFFFPQKGVSFLLEGLFLTSAIYRFFELDWACNFVLDLIIEYLEYKSFNLSRFHIFDIFFKYSDL